MIRKLLMIDPYVFCMTPLKEDGKKAFRHPRVIWR